MTTSCLPWLPRMCYNSGMNIAKIGRFGPLDGWLDGVPLARQHDFLRGVRRLRCGNAGPPAVSVLSMIRYFLLSCVLTASAVCVARDAKRENYRETETDVETRVVQKPASGTTALKIVEGPGWVPFTYFKNIEAGSALDFSGESHLDRPAGKHGRVIVKDGHFAFADSPDVSRHFWGCNINGEAMCPDHDLAVEVAERLARTGYNAVRIHHYDSPITRAGKGRTELDPVQMEKFDFFVAELVKRGLYLETDLFVSRAPIYWRDLGIDRDGEVERYSRKALMSFHPPAYSNWCAFARSFLTHRNPYTGTTVAELPWIGISLINEGRFVYPFPTLPKIEPFQEKWRTWIAARRAADPGCYPELGPRPKAYPRVEWADQNNGTIPRAAADFCADLECAFVARARPFLASLGVKAPLSNQNNSAHYAAMGLVRDETYDFFDIHSYGGGMGKDKMPTPCSADNPLTSNGDRIERTVFARPWSSPVVISEWNYGWPNPHRPAGTFKTATMAALQDWGAVFRFAYTHGLLHLHEGKFKASRFDVALDYANLASERLAFALFARGDLKPLSAKVALEIDPAAMYTPENWAKGICPTNWSAKAAWRTAWGVSAPGRLPLGMRTMKLSAAWTEEPQDLGEDRPDVAYDPVRGTLAVTTPSSAVVAAPSGKMAAGAFTADFGADPCTAFVLSLDGKPLAASRRLLVSCLGDVQFDGIEYTDATRTVIQKKGDYGRPLVRDMKIPVSLELDPQAAYTVYALDTAGRRIGTLPVSGASRPALCFTAATRGPDGRGVLNWEIVRK